MPNIENTNIMIALVYAWSCLYLSSFYICFHTLEAPDGYIYEGLPCA